MFRALENCRLRMRAGRVANDSHLPCRARRGRLKFVLRRGTAAVEFALVAPVFFVLVFGLIELGRMVMLQQALTNAAREGCRTATLATTLSSSDVETKVRARLKSAINKSASGDTVRVTVPSGLANTPAGTNLSVAIEVDYADVSWLPLQYLQLNPTIAAKQIGKRE